MVYIYMCLTYYTNQIQNVCRFVRTSRLNSLVCVFICTFKSNTRRAMNQKQNLCRSVHPPCPFFLLPTAFHCMCCDAFPTERLFTGLNSDTTDRQTRFWPVAADYRSSGERHSLNAIHFICTWPVQYFNHTQRTGFEGKHLYALEPLKQSLYGPQSSLLYPAHDKFSPFKNV